jgi:hypothetical protein
MKIKPKNSMKYFIGVILILIFTSCTVRKEFRVVKFRTRAESYITGKLHVPKDCEIKIENPGPDGGGKILCVYKDSSFIYIRNYGFIEEDIHRYDFFIIKFIRQIREQIYEFISSIITALSFHLYPDDWLFFVSSGMNDKALYWKEIDVEIGIIGYDNVPQEKKELFDKSLETFRMKFSLFCSPNCINMKKLQRKAERKFKKDSLKM